MASQNPGGYFIGQLGLKIEGLAGFHCIQTVAYWTINYWPFFTFTLLKTNQVEIVMGIEEAFDITLGEESANKIATVQDAADLVEKLVTEKECWEFGEN